RAGGAGVVPDGDIALQRQGAVAQIEIADLEIVWVAPHRVLDAGEAFFNLAGFDHGAPFAEGFIGGAACKSERGKGGKDGFVHQFTPGRSMCCFVLSGRYVKLMLESPTRSTT